VLLHDEGLQPIMSGVFLVPSSGCLEQCQQPIEIRQQEAGSEFRKFKPARSFNN
jgi:hypothetical protein